MPIRNKKPKSGEEGENQQPHPPENKHGGGGHDESNWLVSYADMMTLLCGFFIMLFSMAKMDVPQYDSFKQAMSKQFGGEYISPTKELGQFAADVVHELGLDRVATVKADALGVSIAFESTVFFETLSADINPSGKQILDTLIEKLKQKEASQKKDYKIVVEGHTDSRPIVGGVYPSNWELSGARAARVVRIFLGHNYSPLNLTAIGYADTHPQVSARTSTGSWDENALAKNRRVVLRILDPSVESIPFPENAKPLAPSAANTAH